MMSSQLKTILILGLKCIVSVTLIIFLVNYLDAQPLYVITGANPFLLASGSALCIALMALSTLKWRLLLIEQGVQMRFGSLFQIQLASQFLNLFMPTVLGGDAYRAMKLRAHTGSFYTALPSVLIDRATGLVALLFIGSLGSVYMFTALPVLGTALILIVFTIAAYWFLIGPFTKWIDRLPDTARFFNLIKFGKKLIAIVQPSRALFYAALISLVFQFLVVCVAYIYAEAIAIPATLQHLLVISPAVNVAEMIPISISGIGVREISYTVLFEKMHLNPIDGLALGVTASILRYVTGALCAVAFLKKFSPALKQISVTPVPAIQ